MTDRPNTPQVCGAGLVLRYVEGHEAEVVYCQRRSGPCPWANAAGAPGEPGGLVPTRHETVGCAAEEARRG